MDRHGTFFALLNEKTDESLYFENMVTAEKVEVDVKPDQTVLAPEKSLVLGFVQFEEKAEFFIQYTMFERVYECASTSSSSAC
ncbi:hypothetical protein ACEQPO_01415 [Bacillus sp. SL00103]